MENTMFYFNDEDIENVFESRKYICDEYLVFSKTLTNDLRRIPYLRYEVNEHNRLMEHIEEIQKQSETKNWYDIIDVYGAAWNEYGLQLVLKMNKNKQFEINHSRKRED